jgi:tetratricopeptide (TPR) repeat protein
VLFGAPVAKEDDAASALRLAAELVSEIEALGLDVRHRVGINAGYVFAGDVGSDLRRDYTVIGDAVNLAARLMGAADYGHVVVADWVASEAGDLFELLDSRQIRVKGKSMPIPVHTLGSPSGESDHFVIDTRRPKVVGRAREQRSTRRVAAHALAGSPRLLVVHGDAGVGGSALVSEVVFDLAQVGWTLFRGRCQQHLQDAPFGVLIPLFERLLGLDDDLAASDRPRRITDTLAELAPRLVPYASLLNGLLSVDIDETADVRALDATERSERLTELLVQLIGAAAQQMPLVLTVDGLHFSDRSTVRLLEQGSAEWKQGQLLVTVTYRDDLAPAFEPDRRRTVDLALGPLDRHGSDLVVRDLLGTDHLPDVLLSEIYRRARGNILVTGELVRAVGASTLLDGESDLDPQQLEELLGDLDVTDRLQRLMMARIDRLAPGPRWTLTRAAAVGSRFDLATLEALLRAERRDLVVPTALQQLVEAGLVESDSPAGNTEFAFRHEAIRDVAYGSILFRTRRVLHHDLAAHLVEVHDRDIDRVSAVIASHYRIAGEHERAALFGVRAGDWALSTYAIDEAERLYSLAGEQFRMAGPSFTVHRSFVNERLGDCASLRGRPGDAVRRQRQALAEWHRLQPDHGTRFPRHLTLGKPRAMRESELCQKIAHAHQRADHYKRALEWLDRAEASAPTRAPLFRAKLSVLRGTTLFRLGRYDGAAEEGARAVELAERTEDRATIAYARDMLAMTYLEQGRLTEAIDQRVEAVALFEAEGDLRGSMGCHNNLGAAYQLVGALDDALDHYERAADHAKRLGNVQGTAIIENNIGEVLLTQGRLDAAAARFTTTVAVHDETGQAPSWAGLALVNLSRVELRRGELERASEQLEAGTRLLRQAQARGLLLEASEQRVELLLAEGRLDAAARSNERFAQDARRLGLQLYEARSALLAGKIAVRRGADRRALEELRQAIALAEAVGAQREQAEAWAEIASAGLDPAAADRAAALRRTLGV